MGAEHAMKARPILFSAPMILALLEGRKTQTRRIVKPRGRASLFDVEEDGSPMWTDRYILDPGNTEWRMRDCPYGKPGDVLWARENFRAWERPTDATDGILFSADEAFVPIDNSAAAAERWLAVYHYDPKRRGPGSEIPSIHMPRWASRLTLQITDVRVERLQDISEADAEAEGVEPPATEREDHDWSICPECGGTGLHGALGASLGYMEVDCADCDTHKKRYQHLWTRINGPGSWDANPWTWALTFTVHQQNVDVFLAAQGDA